MNQLSYELEEVAPNFNFTFFFLQQANLIGPWLKNKKTKEAPPNWRFYTWFTEILPFDPPN
jgi:hypothetical protein